VHQRESSASGTARRVAPAETIGASANQRQIFGVLAAKLGANATAWFIRCPRSARRTAKPPPSRSRMVVSGAVQSIERQNADQVIWGSTVGEGTRKRGVFRYAPGYEYGQQTRRLRPVQY